VVEHEGTVFGDVLIEIDAVVDAAEKLGQLGLPFFQGPRSPVVGVDFE
jgi:hypothetical protein